MRLLSCCRQAILFSAVMLAFSVSPRICSADTYEIVSLGSDAGVFLYGIDNSGTVVLDSSLFCEGTCYSTYEDGVFAGESVTAPDLDFDDGSSCSPATPAGFVTENAVCNGDFEAFTGRPSADLPTTGVYTGDDLSADLVALGGEGTIMLNANGDIVWDDDFSEEIYEGIDLTPPDAPEPSSLVLLGTGALLLLAFVKIRSAKTR